MEQSTTEITRKCKMEISIKDKVYCNKACMFFEAAVCHNPMVNGYTTVKLSKDEIANEYKRTADCISLFGSRQRKARRSLASDGRWDLSFEQFYKAGLEGINLEDSARMLGLSRNSLACLIYNSSGTPIDPDLALRKQKCINAYFEGKRKRHEKDYHRQKDGRCFREWGGVAAE